MDDYNFENQNLIITPFDYDYGTYDTELETPANLQYNVDIHQKGETLFDNGYWDTIPGTTTDLESGLGEFQQIHVGEIPETNNIMEATSRPEINSFYEQEFQDALRDCLGKLYVEPNATCQPNVQICSHPEPDLPKSRKRRCHNDLVIPKKVSKKDEPKWCDNEDEEKPDDLQKPFSFYTLVTLAILNAPEKRIATNQVYYFLLHHFPYFRYANHNWENSVRNAITGSGTKGSAYFMKVGEERVQNKHKITVFGFKNEELAVKRAIEEIEKYNAEEELRGRGMFVSSTVSNRD
uniref:Fork-head domain-containing protein n=1 Tax=Caenorhabditis japonica TaxID=281687 RepID=A0A8R1DW00_CAEJA